MIGTLCSDPLVPVDTLFCSDAYRLVALLHQKSWHGDCSNNRAKHEQSQRSGKYAAANTRRQRHGFFSGVGGGVTPPAGDDDADGALDLRASPTGRLDAGAVAVAAVADAVVYAVPVAGAATASRGARNVVIEQVGREFVPYVTVVQVGTTVAFPNRDRLLHHVYSFSPAKTFEIKLYSGAAPFDVLFDKVGVVTIGCNIHDWMIAYVYVVDTPYFARSDATGRAAIGEMAAGDYDLHLWHPQQRSQPAVMRVKLDGKAGSDLALTIDVAPRRQKFKPPANPAAYQ